MSEGFLAELPIEILIEIMRLCDAVDHLEIIGILPQVDAALESLYRKAADRAATMNNVFAAYRRQYCADMDAAKKHFRLLDKEIDETEDLLRQLKNDRGLTPYSSTDAYMREQEGVAYHLDNLWCYKDHYREYCEEYRKCNNELPSMVQKYIDALSHDSLKEVLLNATYDAGEMSSKARMTFGDISFRHALA